MTEFTAPSRVIELLMMARTPRGGVWVITRDDLAMDSFTKDRRELTREDMRAPETYDAALVVLLVDDLPGDVWCVKAPKCFTTIDAQMAELVHFFGIGVAIDAAATETMSDADLDKLMKAAGGTGIWPQYGGRAPTGREAPNAPIQAMHGLASAVASTKAPRTMEGTILEVEVAKMIHEFVLRPVPMRLDGDGKPSRMDCRILAREIIETVKKGDAP